MHHLNANYMELAIVILRGSGAYFAIAVKPRKSAFYAWAFCLMVRKPVSIFEQKLRNSDFRAVES